MSPLGLLLPSLGRPCPKPSAIGVRRADSAPSATLQWARQFRCAAVGEVLLLLSLLRPIQGHSFPPLRAAAVHRPIRPFPAFLPQIHAPTAFCLGTLRTVFWDDRGGAVRNCRLAGHSRGPQLAEANSGDLGEDCCCVALADLGPSVDSPFVWGFSASRPVHSFPPMFVPIHSAVHWGHHPPERTLLTISQMSNQKPFIHQQPSVCRMRQNQNHKNEWRATKYLLLPSRK